MVSLKKQSCRHGVLLKMPIPRSKFVYVLSFFCFFNATVAILTSWAHFYNIGIAASIFVFVSAAVRETLWEVYDSIL